jgi:hypothetical protein
MSSSTAVDKPISRVGLFPPFSQRILVGRRDGLYGAAADENGLPHEFRFFVHGRALGAVLIYLQ